MTHEAASRALGVGLGFREQFVPDLPQRYGEIDFFELIGDTLFDGERLEVALEATKGRPVVCHFLSASLATEAPLDADYTRAMRRVMDATGALWLSDHLAITSVPGLRLGHLAPAIFDDRTVDLVTDKIKLIQDATGKPFLIENISYLFAAPGGMLEEAEVLNRICFAADCGLLLDLNNLHVNALNHRYDPYRFLEALPLRRACQVHIAGSCMKEGLMIDTHSNPVPDAVFDLLARVRREGGAGSILLERDRDFPAFEELLSEMRRARAIWVANDG